MPLSLTFYIICPMKTSIKPLRRIRHCHLIKHHICHFFIVCFCIFSRIKIIKFFAPVCPTTNHSIYYLFNACFRTQSKITHFILCRNTFFSKIFLSKNICCYLRIKIWNFNIFHLKYYGTIGITNH